MTRILVTGGTGFIGKQVVQQLHDAGYKVHAIARKQSIALPTTAKWHEVDLMNAGQTAGVIKETKPDVLMHLAWPLVTGNTNSEQHRHFLHASERLVRTFHEQGGERIIVGGTCFEYDFTKGICSESETPLKPSTVYGGCKDALRRFIETCDTKSWAWGRIFFVYGPQQDPTRFVPAVIRGLLAQQPVACTQGLQVRDYLHSHDVASGLIRLFESGLRGDCNIGSGQPTTLRDIASEIASIVGGAELLKFGAKVTPAGEPPVILADVARLRDQLGWQPQFTLSQGLAQTIEHYRTTARVSALA